MTANFSFFDRIFFNSDLLLLKKISYYNLNLFSGNLQLLFKHVNWWLRDRKKWNHYFFWLWNFNIFVLYNKASKNIKFFYLKKVNSQKQEMICEF
jgi:hypothetical protein